MRILRRLMETILAFLLLLGIIWFITTQPVFAPKKSPASPLKADPSRLAAFVTTLSAVLPPRAHGEAQLEPTVVWIEEQMRQFGSPERQSFRVDDENYHNVILHFGPQTDELIVVGAHYDTHDGLPGADDNASGVAGLLELARLLSQTRLNTGVQLVAYTLEEDMFFRTDLMGSYIHANALKQQGKAVKLMISLEMIGYFSDEPDSQHFPLPFLQYLYPDKGNFIGVIGNWGVKNMLAARTVKRLMRQHIELPVYSFNAPALVPGIDFSDHRNYWEMNYPAVMITDTAYQRNLAYHTHLDTAERLDYNKMAQVTEGVLQVILDYQ